MSQRGELLTIADDEAVLWHGARPVRRTELSPDTAIEIDGVQARTLPRFGELLSRVATVNDVHFGEVVAGRMGDSDEFPGVSVPEGAEPYPEVMNRGAVTDISKWEPDVVVAKGDLTSDGTMAQFERFSDVYEDAFGDSLMVVRGNHESFHGLEVAAAPIQERELPGVLIALLDTSRNGRVNGDLSADQLDWLDELGSVTDRPVLVFGHHPVWDAEHEPRSDDTFGLVPAATEALLEVFIRHVQLRGYFAGHTHRNRVVRVPQRPEVPFAEVACVKDYPGSWAEYRVFEGGILQIHRRISTPDALAWTERTRQMFAGAYPSYARGARSERCFEVCRL